MLLAALLGSGVALADTGGGAAAARAEREALRAKLEQIAEEHRRGQQAQAREQEQLHKLLRRQGELVITSYSIHYTKLYDDARGSFQRWQPGGDSAWARFHALGHDAYLLSRQVRGGGWPNGLSLAGASGDLRIEGSRISRQLPCAVYRDGRPELVSVP